jgi:hypothetical protein
MSTNGHSYSDDGQSTSVSVNKTAQFRVFTHRDSGTERAYYYL